MVGGLAGTDQIPAQSQLTKVSFWGFMLLSIVCLAGSIVLETPLPMILPVGLGVATLVFFMPRLFPKLYFILLPFSMEVNFTDSLGTDLPTEPLLLLMAALAIVHMVTHVKQIDRRLFTHPVSIIISAHLGWILLTSLLGTQQLIGLKFLAAKSWYIAALYLLPMLWFKIDELLSLIKYGLIGLIPLAAYILFIHSQSGFGFEEANFVMHPWFRNHVVYAVYLLHLIPFVYIYWRRRRERHGKARYWLWIGVFLSIALYFNYTRIAHIGLVLLPFAYLVMRWRLTRIVLLSAALGVTVIAAWLTVDNKYMDMAPDYATTVAHKNFEDLLTATFKGKDISSMERIYRWVAGGFMIQDRPMTGFGPGSFYESYRPYTVHAFRTYVSDNPERSGMHNYFLMLLVEQGILGLIIFLGLIVFALSRAERLYHSTSSARDRQVCILIYLTMVIVALVHLLNDLIETDKIGTFFFLALAMLVLLDVKQSRVVPSKSGSVVRSSSNGE